MPDDDWEYEDDTTDPNVFEPIQDDVITAKRCVTCGADPEAFKRGAISVLNALFVYLQGRGLSRAEAEAIVDGVRNAASLELV